MMRPVLKPLTLACFVLFMAGITLFLAQMWFHVFAPDVLLKLLITDGALLLIGLVWGFLVRESRESAKIDKDSMLP